MPDTLARAACLLVVASASMSAAAADQPVRRPVKKPSAASHRAEKVDTFKIDTSKPFRPTGPGKMMVLPDKPEVMPADPNLPPGAVREDPHDTTESRTAKPRG